MSLIYFVYNQKWTKSNLSNAMQLKVCFKWKAHGNQSKQLCSCSTHLSAILFAYPLYSVVLGLAQHSTHHVRVLTARRQFNLSLLLLLEVNKSLLCDWVLLL